MDPRDLPRHIHLVRQRKILDSGKIIRFNIHVGSYQRCSRITGSDK